MPHNPTTNDQHRVAVILGSNIDREQNIPAAVRLLAEAATVIDVSTVYETSAVGSCNQPGYFNAVVLLETALSPAELKDGLLADIEYRLGRRRTADKFAARTIDLDIVTYDDESFDYTPADGRPRHLPDRDLLLYPHIAVPLAELLPDERHPETGETFSTIAGRLLDEAAGHGYIIFPRPDVDLRSLLTGDGPTD
ncbi:MAG TPA: 2-amino-4-hydroxy-6-hydroxymethyldihydropteridine diphosphokinase [Promineifilum sp.]|nr:2-amino-4-hydroxy-6-hydroxymethyldihydropteridine diphosphokinase [Promineifilum sp.]HRO23106.1 2-amino-4-hydroxy-6-hydroxymethyldihydropteridine diphosphokinase [Promineifilum sp.]HRO90610.1 2-amino-4-hydroxy-6-hydroxymethyldihydropteridine diphosphokinase [Promineifilum sp.]HRQ12894.1 2-amino-4-hydroxy-6-hydroxymethyldihydropteridine diphosphokinase [Promineifilum sp.]